MQIWANGHTKELNAMNDEFKLDLVNELKSLHQQVAKLWQANSTLQREVLERAGKIENELGKISVILEKDGIVHSTVAHQVYENRKNIEENSKRLDNLVTKTTIMFYVFGIVATASLPIIIKALIEWVGVK